MYLSSSVGTNEAGVNGPMQALTKVTLPTVDALGDAQEVEWIPGESKFAMEPFFVARKGAIDEDDGWVVALVHDANYEKSDFGGRGTEMVIIDAKKFEEGPVARIRLPVYIPFGVHGSWSTRYVAGPPKEAERKAISVRQQRQSERSQMGFVGSAAVQSVQPGADMTDIGWPVALVVSALTILAFFQL